MANKLSQEDAMAKIKKYAGLGFAMGAAGVYFSYNYLPISLPVMETATDRLLFSLQWSILPFLVLMGSIQRVADIRGTKAWNPTDSKTEVYTDVANRILRNTTEQLIIFLGGLFILTAELNNNQMKIVPILVVLWTLARTIYAYGYQINPVFRSFGFVITMVPTLLMYVFTAYLFWTRNPTILAYLAPAAVLCIFNPFGIISTFILGRSE